MLKWWNEHKTTKKHIWQKGHARAGNLDGYLANGLGLACINHAALNHAQEYLALHSAFVTSDSFMTEDFTSSTRQRMPY